MVVSFSKVDLGLLARFLTSAALKHHLSKPEKAKDPLCLLCQKGFVSREHILCESVAVNRTGRQHFSSLFRTKT